MNENLLKVKKNLKKKNPEPRRVEKHRHPQLPDNWRKPKGHHSKIRRGKKWELRMPKIGRKTPVLLQNLDKLGRELIKIKTIDDLKNLSDKTVGVVASKLGLKKKLLIAQKSLGKNYKFLNFNPEKIIKKAKDMLDKKKEKPKAEIKEAVLEKSAAKPVKPMAKPVKPTAEQKIESSEKKAIKPKKELKGE
jgi:large subunit ribosomal protein L32e